MLFICLRTDPVSFSQSSRLKLILSVLPHGSHFLYLWKLHGSVIVSLLVFLQLKCPKIDVVLQLTSYQCWSELNFVSWLYRAVCVPQCEVCWLIVYDAAVPVDAFLRGVLLTSVIFLCPWHPSIFNSILVCSDHFSALLPFSILMFVLRHVVDVHSCYLVHCIKSMWQADSLSCPLRKGHTPLRKEGLMGHN